MYLVRIIALSTLFLSVGAPSNSFAVDSWGEPLTVCEKENMTIYIRKSTENPELWEYRGIGVVSASLSRVLAAIRDVERMHEWVFQVESAITHKLISETERITYIVHKSPVFGADSRDNYVHSSLTQNPTTGVVKIEGISKPNEKPLNPNYVRIPFGRSTWELTPNGTSTRVIFRGTGDPGGAIGVFKSTFLVGRYLWKLPCETIRRLKKQVLLDEYKNVEFSFIQSPSVVVQ